MDLSSKKIGTPINQRNTANQGGRTIGKLQHFGEQATAKHLTEGQVIKGEVTDLRNSQVSILLEDNTKVIGRLDHVNWLSIGDIGSFKVESVDSGSIRLQAIPLSDLELENNTMFKALEEAGLPHNSRNQSIVLSLIRNQLPITKPSILNVLKQSYELKEASIRTIVLLNKYNIPATHSNASQLENYLSGNQSLSAELSQCLDQIPSLLREIALYADQDMPALAKEFMSLVHENATEQTALMQEEQPYVFTSNRIKNEILSILSDFDMSDEVHDSILKNNLTATELNQIIETCYDKALAIDSRNQEEALLSLSPEELANQLKVDAVLSEIPKITDAFDHAEFAKIDAAFQEALKNSQLIGGFFPEGSRNKLADFFMQNPANEALAKLVRNGAMTLNDVMNGIQNTLSFASPESLQELFISDEFMFLISNELKKQWSLTPDQIRKKENLGNYFQKLSNQASGINKLIQSISPDFQESLAGNSLASVKSNIDFMQLLNGIFPYVQFPFASGEFNGNGELFVYTRKDELKRNPHQITVLLHLSLAHLGKVDIHITKNGLVLTNKFFLEEEQSRRLLKKNISLLSDKLQELGYSVTNEFEKKESKIDILNDFIAQKEPATAIKRYSFDIRA